METRIFFINPSFTEQFYTATGKKEKIEINFPLPSGPDNLVAFAASEGGAEFKNGVKTIFNKLSSWLQKNTNIDEVSQVALQTQLDELRVFHDFIINSIDSPASKLSDREANVVLYQNAIPLLAKIADMITAEETEESRLEHIATRKHTITRLCVHLKPNPEADNDEVIRIAYAALRCNVPLPYTPKEMNNIFSKLVKDEKDELDFTEIRQQFNAKLNATVDKLIAWVKDHPDTEIKIEQQEEEFKVKEANLNWFKNQFSLSTGSYGGLKDFKIFREGMPGLLEIIDTLYNNPNKIPLTTCKTTIVELCKSIIKCGDGANTQIKIANAALNPSPQVQLEKIKNDLAYEAACEVWKKGLAFDVSSTGRKFFVTPDVELKKGNKVSYYEYNETHFIAFFTNWTAPMLGSTIDNDDLALYLAKNIRKLYAAALQTLISKNHPVVLQHIQIMHEIDKTSPDANALFNMLLAHPDKKALYNAAARNLSLHEDSYLNAHNAILHEIRNDTTNRYHQYVSSDDEIGLLFLLEKYINKVNQTIIPLTIIDLLVPTVNYEREIEELLVKMGVKDITALLHNTDIPEVQEHVIKCINDSIQSFGPHELSLYQFFNSDEDEETGKYTWSRRTADDENLYLTYSIFERLKNSGQITAELKPDQIINLKNINIIFYKGNHAFSYVFSREFEKTPLKIYLRDAFLAKNITAIKNILIAAATTLTSSETTEFSLAAAKILHDVMAKKLANILKPTIKSVTHSQTAASSAVSSATQDRKLEEKVREEKVMDEKIDNQQLAMENTSHESQEQARGWLTTWMDQMQDPIYKDFYNKSGITYLFFSYAITFDNIELFKKLIANGAPLGQASIETAMIENKWNFVDLIIEHDSQRENYLSENKFQYYKVLMESIFAKQFDITNKLARDFGSQLSNNNVLYKATVREFFDFLFLIEFISTNPFMEHIYKNTLPAVMPEKQALVDEYLIELASKKNFNKLLSKNFSPQIPYLIHVLKYTSPKVFNAIYHSANENNTSKKLLHYLNKTRDWDVFLMLNIEQFSNVISMLKEMGSLPLLINKMFCNALLDHIIKNQISINTNPHKNYVPQSKILDNMFQHFINAAPNDYVINLFSTGGFVKTIPMLCYLLEKLPATMLRGIHIDTNDIAKAVENIMDTSNLAVPHSSEVFRAIEKNANAAFAEKFNQAVFDAINRDILKYFIFLLYLANPTTIEFVFKSASKLNPEKINKFLQRSINADGNILHQAALGNNPELVRALIKYGANPFAVNAGGDTAVYLAAATGNWDVVNLYLELQLPDSELKILSYDKVWDFAVFYQKLDVIKKMAMADEVHMHVHSSSAPKSPLVSAILLMTYRDFRSKNKTPHYNNLLAVLLLEAIKQCTQDEINELATMHYRNRMFVLHIAKHVIFTEFKQKADTNAIVQAFLNNGAADHKLMLHDENELFPIWLHMTTAGQDIFKEVLGRLPVLAQHVSIKSLEETYPGFYSPILNLSSKQTGRFILETLFANNPLLMSQLTVEKFYEIHAGESCFIDLAEAPALLTQIFKANKLLVEQLTAINLYKVLMLLSSSAAGLAFLNALKELKPALINDIPLKVLCENVPLGINRGTSIFAHLCTSVEGIQFLTYLFKTNPGFAQELSIEVLCPPKDLGEVSGNTPLLRLILMKDGFEFLGKLSKSNSKLLSQLSLEGFTRFTNQENSIFLTCCCVRYLTFLDYLLNTNPKLLNVSADILCLSITLGDQAGRCPLTELVAGGELGQKILTRILQNNPKLIEELTDDKTSAAAAYFKRTGAEKSAQYLSQLNVLINKDVQTSSSSAASATSTASVAASGMYSHKHKRKRSEDTDEVEKQGNKPKNEENDKKSDSPDKPTNF